VPHQDAALPRPAFPPTGTPDRDRNSPTVQGRGEGRSLPGQRVHPLQRRRAQKCHTWQRRFLKNHNLRHSALSTWLNAGVDATEVAERAGNSVEVLLSRYAKCIDGRQEVANRRIEDLLREYG
jgi:integrase